MFATKSTEHPCTYKTPVAAIQSWLQFHLLHLHKNSSTHKAFWRPIQLLKFYIPILRVFLMTKVPLQLLEICYYVVHTSIQNKQWMYDLFDTAMKVYSSGVGCWWKTLELPFLVEMQSYYLELNLSRTLRRWMNVTGPFIRTRKAFRRMKARGKGGRIVNIGSISVIAMYSMLLLKQLYPTSVYYSNDYSMYDILHFSLWLGKVLYWKTFPVNIPWDETGGICDSGWHWIMGSARMPSAC